MQIVEIIILEFVFTVISVIWFHGGSIIFGHDSGVSFIPINHYLSVLFSWNPFINFGYAWSQIYSRAFLLTYTPETIFYLLSRNIYVAQYLSCLFWLSLMGLAMYIYVSDIYRDTKFRLMRIFSPIFYVVNFYILQAWLIDERTKFSLYAALPLGLMIIRRMFKQKQFNLRYPIYLVLLFFLLNGGGQPPYYGAILIAYPLYFVFQTFMYSKHYERPVWRSVTYVLSSVGLVLLVNAFYLIPYIYDLGKSFFGQITLSSGMNSFIEWEQEISKNASIVNLLRLQGIPDWYANFAHPFSNQFIIKRSLIFFSFIPILIILSGLGLTNWKANEEKGRKTEILFLLLLLCIGILFAGGTHLPFGQFYVFAMEHIPGFIMFRSSFYKFAPLVWFSTSVLSGYFLVICIQYFRSKAIKIICSIAICVGLLLYHYPYFSTTAFDFRPGFTTRLTIPEYTVNMAKEITAMVPFDGRILLYPPLDMGYIGTPLDTYTWGYYSLDPMPRMISDHIIVANDAYSPLRIIENLQQALHDGDSQSFLSTATVSGITHVLWRGDVKRSEAMDKDIPLSEMDHRLSTMSALSKQVSEGPWTLYKVTTQVRPMVYVTSQEGNNLPEILFKEVNPTRYNVEVSSKRNASFVLVFNQQFNQGWRAKAYTIDGRSMILTNHFMVNEFANAWMVDDTQIQRVEIEYMPQRYFYYGLAVSAMTFMGIIIYFVWDRKRRIIRN